MDLTNKDELISYLQSQGLYTKHRLGQNFLVDKTALAKIIEAGAIQPDDLVIEVGPGLGVLTGELVKKAKKVIAVEIDEKLAKLLATSFNTVISTPPINRGAEKSIKRSLHAGRDDTGNNLEIINSDILSVNVAELTKGYVEYKVVANIPYYITSKIIKQFLTTDKKPEAIVMLVQKEVAERICAKPGAMSILALSVQLYGEPEIIDIVKKESFFPAPDVDSAILRIAITKTQDTIINQYSIFSFQSAEQFEKELFRAIKIGFASKRKTLENNLSSGFHLEKTVAQDIIKSVGLDKNVRAQELSLEDWGKLAKKLNIK